MTAYRNFSTRQTPQSQPIPGSTQVANSAGGFTWEIDDWGKLDRFLILGSEGGTYYIKEQELTQKNAEAALRCIKEDGFRVVNRVIEISQSGRAARNDPALFVMALAISFGNDDVKRAVAAELPKVARIGTHLFHFAQYAQNMRGWGKTLKRAVSNWYDEKHEPNLAYQMVKYQQRNGWGHADLIKLSHPKTHGVLYNWALRGKPGHEDTIAPINTIVEGFVRIQAVNNVKEAVQLINQYRLPREAVPTQFLNEKEIWAALLDTDMGYEAMIRNLGNMGKNGLLVPMSDAVKKVIARLEDEDELRKSRLHPIKILAAMKTYEGGKGIHGSNEWPVVSQIVDALDKAFYASFGNVEPTGKNTMLALDISGSMGSAIMNMPYLSAREGSVAMALVTASAEPNHMVVGFSAGSGKSMHSMYGTAIKPLSVRPRQRLTDAVKAVSGLPFGGTDCALPMMYALEQKLEIDTFIIYTDSETWAGNIQPTQALQKYRREMNRPKAKLVVVGMTSNGFTLADPNDAGMLDCVGFDTGTPEVISNFSRE